MSRATIDVSFDETAEGRGAVRSYRAPWKGQLVLVCRKCQRKLKHDGKKSGLAKLSKALRKRSRREEDGPALYVVDVSCLNLCPRGGVTVCTVRQLARKQCSIVRTRADVDALLEQCKDKRSR